MLTRVLTCKAESSQPHRKEIYKVGLRLLIACTCMRLHIKGLQRIVSVTESEASSLQAMHYVTDTNSPRDDYARLAGM